MNTGYEGKKYEIFAYNGGLFAPDKILDTIKISDDLLYKHTINLSNYDFESEVSVNILGHIFEHSLTEIETIQAQLEGQEIDKSKTKRKKDGVFYTPKYITKYIVDNTVGKLCDEKKIEIGIDENEFNKDRKGRKQATLKKLSKQLDDYRNWLLQITICDPACGSGAFLNQALQFLIAEHRYIDELKAKLLGDAMVFSEVQNEILENNIFGVDINQESVEIAKLSLWLRTAKKGRKLKTLNNNVKCGNSLIDDLQIAGEKAFNWSEQFPDVFSKGGFDVIIGNPPYGTISNKDSVEYFKSNFSSFQGNLENYCFFTELFISLAKNESGEVGLIIPTTWLTIPQFENLRKVVLSNRLNSIIDLPTKVFGDADLDTIIGTITKTNNLGEVKVSSVDKATIASFESSVSKFVNIDQNIWLESDNHKINLDYNPLIEAIIKKVKAESLMLKDLFNVSQGIVPYARVEMYKSMEKEVADEIVDKRLWHSNYKKDMDFKPELKGEDVTRFSVKWNGNQYVRYGTWLARPRTSNFFKEPRILIREITRGNKLNAGFTDNELYNNPGIINIIDKDDNTNLNLMLTLLAIVNSSFMYFYHLNTSPKAKLKTSIPKILIKDCENLPIPTRELLLSSNLNELTTEIIELKKQLINRKENVVSFLSSRFELNSVSKKLKSWHLLDIKTLVKELKKQKVNISISEQAELDTYIKDQQEIYNNVQNDYNLLEKKIDNSVFRMFQLSENEIEIITKAIA